MEASAIHGAEATEKQHDAGDCKRGVDEAAHRVDDSRDGQRRDNMDHLTIRRALGAMDCDDGRRAEASGVNGRSSQAGRAASNRTGQYMTPAIGGRGLEMGVRYLRRARDGAGPWAHGNGCCIGGASSAWRRGRRLRGDGRHAGGSGVSSGHSGCVRGATSSAEPEGRGFGVHSGSQRTLRAAAALGMRRGCWSSFAWPHRARLHDPPQLARTLNRAAVDTRNGRHGNVEDGHDEEDEDSDAWLWRCRVLALQAGSAAKPAAMRSSRVWARQSVNER